MKRSRTKISYLCVAALSWQVEKRNGFTYRLFFALGGKNEQVVN
jgi:hypothetical protein